MPSAAGGTGGSSAASASEDSAVSSGRGETHGSEVTDSSGSAPTTSDVLDDVGTQRPNGPELEGIAATSGHACAWLPGGRVRCWGENGFGQLGLGHTEPIGDDETIASGEDAPFGEVLAVALGSSSTCARLTDGSVRCAGRNDEGALGIGTTEAIGDDEPVSTGLAVGLPGPATAIAGAESSYCAIIEGGEVFCWGGEGRLIGYGDGFDGYVGDDELPLDVGPLDLPAEATRIAVSGSHACAVVQPGDVYCWGNNTSGAVGVAWPWPSSTTGLTPATLGPVELDGTVIEIATASELSCALFDDGRVRCWGSINGFSPSTAGGLDGDVGDDETPLVFPPVDVGFVPNSIRGGRQICAMSGDGRARCWPGVIGYPEVSWGLEWAGLGPTELGDLELGEAAKSVASPCAVTQSGLARCWGDGAILWPIGGGIVGDDETPAEVPPIAVFE